MRDLTDLLEGQRSRAADLACPEVLEGVAIDPDDRERDDALSPKVLSRRDDECVAIDDDRAPDGRFAQGWVEYFEPGLVEDRAGFQIQREQAIIAGPSAGPRQSCCCIHDIIYN